MLITLKNGLCTAGNKLLLRCQGKEINNLLKKIMEELGCMEIIIYTVTF